MSIIYDALKKVESKFKEFNKTGANSNSSEKKKVPVKVYLLFLLLIVIGFVSTKMFFNILAAPPQKNTQQILSSKINTAGAPAKIQEQKNPNFQPQAAPSMENRAQAPTTRESPSSPSLVLNGIFFSEDEGYALINNKILREGDTIEGVTVEKIDLDEVELKSGDSTIKLSTNSR